MAATKFKLNTGSEIPALGLGTWQSAPGEVKKAVSYALSIGYKHIDAGSSSLPPSPPSQTSHAHKIQPTAMATKTKEERG